MDTNNEEDEEKEVTFKTHSEHESEGSVSSTAEIEQRGGDILTISETIEFEESEENDVTKLEKGNLNETEVATKSFKPDKSKDLKISATKELMESSSNDEIVRRSMSEGDGSLFSCDATFLEYMVKKFKSDQSARQSEIDKKRASNR